MSETYIKVLLTSTITMPTSLDYLRGDSVIKESSNKVDKRCMNLDKLFRTSKNAKS